MPSKNPGEQQFIYLCLSAWLIKHKCHMNLELEPEEYEDQNATIDVILEALRLITAEDDEPVDRSTFVDSLGFPITRLKNGFGPEVVWTLNILADRALELMLESQQFRGIRVVYNNKSTLDSANYSKGGDSITIGQPFVGGGLTTRPLGNYQIDDESLLFGGCVKDASFKLANARDTLEEAGNEPQMDPDEWLRRVEECAPMLESVNLFEDSAESPEEWQNFQRSITGSRKQLREFVTTLGPVLNAIVMRIDRQLQVITTREKFIQTNLKSEIEKFSGIWKNYSEQSNRYKNLEAQVNLRTDKFETMTEKLKELNGQIEARKRELNDGSDLKEIATTIDRMRAENKEFDVKIGLLLTVYADAHAKFMSTTS